MKQFDPNKPHQEVHGPGSDCAYIQDGMKFNGAGAFMAYEDGSKPPEEKPKTTAKRKRKKGEKKPCPYCGRMFSALHAHLRHCKKKPEEGAEDGRNVGEPDRQADGNEPEAVAPGGNQTSIVIGRQ